MLLSICLPKSYVIIVIAFFCYRKQMYLVQKKKKRIPIIFRMCYFLFFYHYYHQLLFLNMRDILSKQKDIKIFYGKKTIVYVEFINFFSFLLIAWQNPNISLHFFYLYSLSLGIELIILSLCEFPIKRLFQPRQLTIINAFYK